MDKTIIALIAVSLGALLPVPTAQGEPVRCPGETIGNVEDSLSQFVSGDLRLEQTVCNLAGVNVPDPTLPDPTLPDPDVGNLPTLGDLYVPKAKGGACAASDDGSGWGNPHASCPISCGVGSQLAMGVASADKPPGDATAYGHLNCGDTAGTCNPTPRVCFGASVGPATEAGSGSCEGYVDELVDDPMTLVCVASAGADFGDDDPAETAKRLVCQVYPDFPTCRDTFAAMAASCIAAHPELLAHGESVIAGLFPAQFASVPVYSYVGGLFLADGTVMTVSYTAGDEICSFV